LPGEYYLIAGSQKQQILEWLSGPTYETKYRDQLDKRASGTGTWILERPAFREWKSSGKQLLWLKGNGSPDQLIVVND